jgi:hypothetical protein
MKNKAINYEHAAERDIHRNKIVHALEFHGLIDGGFIARDHWSQGRRWKLRWSSARDPGERAAAYKHLH